MHAYTQWLERRSTARRAAASPDGSGHIIGSKFSGSVEIGGWGPTSMMPYVLRPDQSKLGSLGSELYDLIHRFQIATLRRAW